MGLVLYSDPSDYAPEGVGVFPRGVAMPGTAVQRGNVKISSGELGDPLTPYCPAIGTEKHLDTFGMWLWLCDEQTMHDMRALIGIMIVIERIGRMALHRAD